MKLVLICLMFVGCGVGHKVKGGTHNEIYTESEVDVDANVEIVLKVDLEVCDQFFQAADKLECITAITGVFESLGDLSKVLVCAPEEPQKCAILEKLIGGLVDDE